MSEGKEGGAAVGGIVIIPLTVAGVAAGVAGAAAVTAVTVAVTAGAIAVTTTVVSAAAVAGATVATVAAVGYGLYEAGKATEEMIKIEKENREQVKKATQQYLESLKLDEAKGDEFVQKVLSYIETTAQLFTKEEAEQIINQEKTGDKRVGKAHELLELTSDYEVLLDNLYTALDMAQKLNLSIVDINQELNQISQSKGDLDALKAILDAVNDKIIDWIREQEKKLEQEVDASVLIHESWKIVSKDRDVIACVCKDEIVELFEKSDNREIAEARIKLVINEKRLALLRLYDALRGLRGFSLFEDKARGILTETLVMFQEEHPELTDTEINSLLDRAIEKMRAVYNDCADMLGRELVEARVKFEDALAYNEAYRKAMGLPIKSLTFNEDEPLSSLDEILKENERLKILYENKEKNKVWMAQLSERFRASGYTYVIGGHEEMVLSDGLVIRTNEYFLTPDGECVVIVSTYSDGRPMQIVVEGIKLKGYGIDKVHIARVQKEHAARCAEILDDLIDGELKEYDPSEETAQDIEVENLPDEYVKRALTAREKRTNAKPTGDQKHQSVE